MAKEKKEKNSSWLEKWVGIVGLLAVLIVIGTYLYNFSGALSQRSDIWAQFGDYFGGVLGPIISLLALIAFLVTIYQGKRTLKELQKTTEIQEKQGEMQVLNNIYKNITETLSKAYQLNSSSITLNDIVRLKKVKVVEEAALWDLLKYDLFTYAYSLCILTEGAIKYLQMNEKRDHFFVLIKMQAERELEIAQSFFQGIMENYTHATAMPMLEETQKMLRRAAKLIESEGEND